MSLKILAKKHAFNNIASDIVKIYQIILGRLPTIEDLSHAMNEYDEKRGLIGVAERCLELREATEPQKEHDLTSTILEFCENALDGRGSSKAGEMASALDVSQSGSLAEIVLKIAADPFVAAFNRQGTEVLLKAYEEQSNPTSAVIGLDSGPKAALYDSETSSFAAGMDRPEQRSNRAKREAEQDLSESSPQVPLPEVPPPEPQAPAPAGQSNSIAPGPAPAPDPKADAALEAAAEQPEPSPQALPQAALQPGSQTSASADRDGGAEGSLHPAIDPGPSRGDLPDGTKPSLSHAVDPGSGSELPTEHLVAGGGAPMGVAADNPVGMDPAEGHAAAADEQGDSKPADASTMAADDASGGAEVSQDPEPTPLPASSAGDGPPSDKPAPTPPTTHWNSAPEPQEIVAEPGEDIGLRRTPTVVHAVYRATEGPDDAKTVPVEGYDDYIFRVEGVEHLTLDLKAGASLKLAAPQAKTITLTGNGPLDLSFEGGTAPGQLERVDASGFKGSFTFEAKELRPLHVIGGTGNDNITLSGDQDNTVDTGAGNDVIRTGNGADEIHAGNGNNIVDAAGGDNLVRTGNGDDVIRSRDGTDDIYTGDGNDAVNAGDGDNTIFLGTSGRKLVVIETANASTLSAGDGNMTKVDGLNAERGDKIVLPFLDTGNIVTTDKQEAIQAEAGRLPAHASLSRTMKAATKVGGVDDGELAPLNSGKDTYLFVDNEENTVIKLNGVTNLPISALAVGAQNEDLAASLIGVSAREIIGDYVG